MIEPLEPRGETRRPNRALVKKALVAVWLVLLAGLAFLMVHFSNSGGMPGTEDTTVPPRPKMDAAKLASEWGQIQANAVAPARGNPNTPYTIAEFGDFQCPTCGKARPTIEKLLATYPQQVNLIFIQRPFPNIHKWALASAEAAEIAAAQGKFWPMYDVLYENQDNLEPGFYADYAAKAGLNKQQFQAAYASHQYKSKVDEAMRFCDKIGIEETPTLLLYDNAHKTVKVYVGLGRGPDTGPGQAVIKDLAASPPWAPAAKTAPTPHH